jgi:tetratricopeptide (TPR) repeat protein
MTRLQKIAMVFFFLLSADRTIYSQPIELPFDDKSHLERLSEILPMIPVIANEYRTGSDYGVQRFQNTFLGDFYMIRIGRADDCANKTRCIYALVPDKATKIPFVTGCVPGQVDGYHNHREDGGIGAAFEFICPDGGSFVMGLSRSSISVNTQPRTAVPAADQVSQYWTWCVNERGTFTPDQAISGCTFLIQSGRESGKNLAIAYYNRGHAYTAKDGLAGDYERAIADYSEAIQLDPKYALAFYQRGLAYSAKADNDRAIADYSEVIRLNPKSGLAFYQRGIAYSDKGDKNRAMADFSEALRLLDQ